MRIHRLASAFAVSVLVLGAGLISTPSAQASTQTVSVNCNTGSAGEFTISSGDSIVFDLSNNGCPVMLGLPTLVSTSAQLQSIVDQVANLSGTGGTAVADVNLITMEVFVTYTAGPRSGTDSIDFAPGVLPRILRPRYAASDYTMTVPGGPTPPPWLQAYGRGSAETCAAGWNPSWAQWPNNNTGGFVCVRTLSYNNNTGIWDSRRQHR